MTLCEAKHAVVKALAPAQLPDFEVPPQLDPVYNLFTSFS